MFLRYHRRGLLYSNLEKSARKDFNDDQKTLIQYFRMAQDRILDWKNHVGKGCICHWLATQWYDFISKRNYTYSTITYRTKFLFHFFVVKTLFEIAFRNQRRFDAQESWARTIIRKISYSSTWMLVTVVGQSSPNVNNMKFCHQHLEIIINIKSPTQLEPVIQEQDTASNGKNAWSH